MDCQKLKSSETFPQVSSRRRTQLQECVVYGVLVLCCLLQLPQGGRAAALPAAVQNSTATPAALVETTHSKPQHTSSLEEALNRSAGSSSSRSKRHSYEHMYLHQHRHADDTHLEWANPCNGVYSPVHADQPRLPVLHFLRDLNVSIGAEFHKAKQHKEIKTNNMASLRLHKDDYKFLPQVGSNSPVNLKRWYRNTQTYIAAFAQLGRQQYNWEKQKQQPISKTTRELNSLLESARCILCLIETTINGSFPDSNQRRLVVMTREEMNRTLRFHNEEDDALGELAADSFDMTFTKHHYVRFIKGMQESLNGCMERAGNDDANAGACFSSSAEESAEQGARKQRRRRREHPPRRANRQY